jgi:hypothetical protein
MSPYSKYFVSSHHCPSLRDTANVIGHLKHSFASESNQADNRLDCLIVFLDERYHTIRMVRFNKQRPENKALPSKSFLYCAPILAVLTEVVKLVSCLGERTFDAKAFETPPIHGRNIKLQPQNTW